MAGSEFVLLIDIYKVVLLIENVIITYPLVTLVYCMCAVYVSH